MTKGDTTCLNLLLITGNCSSFVLWWSAVYAEVLNTQECSKGEESLRWKYDLNYLLRIAWAKVGWSELDWRVGGGERDVATLRRCSFSVLEVGLEFRTTPVKKSRGMKFSTYSQISNSWRQVRKFVSSDKWSSGQRGISTWSLCLSRYRDSWPWPT